MVDFLRIFRRRTPARGRQGFARSSADITSLGERMGDIFNTIRGVPSSREPMRDAPVRREAQPLPEYEGAPYDPASYNSSSYELGAL